MNSKLEYEVNQNLERITLTAILQKAMAVFRKAEEGTEIYQLTKELIDCIEEKQKGLDEIKSMLYIIASKL